MERFTWKGFINSRVTVHFLDNTASGKPENRDYKVLEVFQDGLLVEEFALEGKVFVPITAVKSVRLKPTQSSGDQDVL